MRFVEHKNEITKIEFTNTRLMGVVGGYVEYLVNQSKVVEVFHIDYEDYGVDRYECYINPSPRDLKMTLKEVCGGLGGEFVRLEYNELVYYLNQGIEVNKRLGVQGDIDELYAKKIKDAVESGFETEKLNTVIEEDYQQIHYALMRTFGQDEIGYKSIVNQPFATDFKGTMLRNAIEFGEECYESTSIVQNEDGYYLFAFEIRFDDLEIIQIELKTQMQISDIEVALLLKKIEYVNIYELANNEVEEFFMNERREYMINLHYNGKAFTEFKTNNDHVKEKVFMLSGDVNAVYFFSDDKQLLVMSYDEVTLNLVDQELALRFDKAVILEESLSFEEQIIYDYIGSDYVDFIEFLKDYL